jgi:hypothetical protein
VGARLLDLGQDTVYLVLRLMLSFLVGNWIQCILLGHLVCAPSYEDSYGVSGVHSCVSVYRRREF